MAAENEKEDHLVLAYFLVSAEQVALLHLVL